MDFSSNHNAPDLLIHASTTTCSSSSSNSSSDSSDHQHGLLIRQQQLQLSRHSSAQVNHPDTATLPFNNSFLALDAPAPAPATDGSHDDDDENISINYSNCVIPLKYSTESRHHHNNSTLKVVSSITTTETNNPPMSIMTDAVQREAENIRLMNRNTPYGYYNGKYESAANAAGGMMQTYHGVTLQKRKALDPLPLLNNVILDQQQQSQLARPLKLRKESKSGVASNLYHNDQVYEVNQSQCSRFMGNLSTTAAAAATLSASHSSPHYRTPPPPPLSMVQLYDGPPAPLLAGHDMNDKELVCGVVDPRGDKKQEMKLPCATTTRTRARRGEATDLHSISERKRRVRITERMRALHKLVPNGSKTNKASMLDEVIQFVTHLQTTLKAKCSSSSGAWRMMSSMGGSDGDGARSRCNDIIERVLDPWEDSLADVERDVRRLLLDGHPQEAAQYLAHRGISMLPIPQLHDCHNPNITHHANTATNATSQHQHQHHELHEDEDEDEDEDDQ